MYTPSSNQPKQKINPLPDSEYNNEWNQEKSFKLLKKFNDPRFGDINVVRNNANQVLMVKEKMASSKNEVTEDITYLKLRSELNHPHLMKLVAFSAITNKELCSTTYVIKAFYEFPRTDTYKEIADRQKGHAGFTSNELSHLAYQTLSALHSLHQRGLAHSDIRPQLIGYDKQRNHFEILDRLADPTPLEKCQTNNMINNKELYLSPQLYKKLKGKDKTIAYSAQRNDTFALGLTILYLGEGQSIQDIYLPNGEIERKKLQEHVMNFDIKHNDNNPLICSLVKVLLQIEESSSNDLRTVLGNIPSYDEYKRSESTGTPLFAQKAKTEPLKVQATPKDDITEPTHDKNFFDIDHHTNHTQHSQPKYQFPVEENEDFGGYNPYMVKTNQVHNQPPQQYHQTQYSNQQHVYHNTEYIPQNTTTTYVRSTPQQLHSYSQNNQPTVTYVHSTPQLNGQHFAQPQTHYVHANPTTIQVNNSNTYFEENGTKVIRRSYQAAPVEVRRGSPVPSPNESKVIKKRYVMREDGTVVELDPNADIGAEEIRKYFDNGYTKNTIGHYDNVDQALKSDHY